MKYIWDLSSKNHIESIELSDILFDNSYLIWAKTTGLFFWFMQLTSYNQVGPIQILEIKKEKLKMQMSPD